nr:helix-turn-helix domain-containing protein [Clostridia bacterium]
MKRDIKPHIRAAAEALFQAQGFGNVSMRDVASAAGISVGNLTYHYKKKEDLIEAVVLE